MGDLTQGVPVDPATEIFDLISDNVINGADLDEWLALAAQHNCLASPYHRGDADLTDSDFGLPPIYDPGPMRKSRSRDPLACRSGEGC